MNQTEISSRSGSVVGLESSLDDGLQVTCSDSSKKQFKFDLVLRPEGNQEAVFAQRRPIVSSVLDGYNVCISAYGQTGTGKTFTMEGTPENRGVNFMRYELCVNMLEVNNNEKIRELLVDNTNQSTNKCVFFCLNVN
ncbi:kinesin-4-like [Pyrus ussuriensis x Pyrus communis]|uniref:Kinesin-4-like n=1 Tax=Pyrus ussuriensis x Pyrus communis TaxID=2448454 RepID=A0A5N5H2I1_9ROSA|nr:kinesin-4-like [Pyrus ussuriensis x Pyrus communis]